MYLRLMNILFFCYSCTNIWRINFKGIKDLSNKESSRAEEMKNTKSNKYKCKSTKDEMKIWGVKQIQKNNLEVYLFLI